MNIELKPVLEGQIKDVEKTAHEIEARMLSKFE